MPSNQGPLAKGLGMLRSPTATPRPRAARAGVAPSNSSGHGTRAAGALSAADGLRDRPQLRLRAEVVVVVEPDKLPSPKEVGSSSSHPPSPRRPAHARRLSLAQRELALSLAQREICAATRPGKNVEKLFLFHITLIVRMRRLF